MKLRNVTWKGHAAGVGRRKMHHRILMGKPMGQEHGEDLGVDDRIPLKWILKR
jgi:hypothetical protein